MPDKANIITQHFLVTLLAPGDEIGANNMQARCILCGYTRTAETSRDGTAELAEMLFQHAAVHETKTKSNESG